MLPFHCFNKWRMVFCNEKFLQQILLQVTINVWVSTSSSNEWKVTPQTRSGTIFEFGMQLHNIMQFEKNYRNYLLTPTFCLQCYFFLQKSTILKKKWSSYSVTNFGFINPRKNSASLFESQMTQSPAIFRVFVKCSEISADIC